MSEQSQSARPSHEPHLASYQRAEPGRSADLTARLGHRRGSPARYPDSAPRTALPGASAERSPWQACSDPVVIRLAQALAVAETDLHRDTEVYAEALRLAIHSRLLELKPALPIAEPAQPLGERRALQKWRLRRVVDYVEQHLAGKVTLADLAAVGGLSRMHFAAQFRAATGLRPHEYLLRRRVQSAEDLLRHSTLSIVEIAMSVGFQTQAHFTTVFKRYAGDTPCQWRHKHGLK